MDFTKLRQLDPMKLLKIIVPVLLGVMAIVFVFSLVSSSLPHFGSNSVSLSSPGQYRGGGGMGLGDMDMSEESVQAIPAMPTSAPMPYGRDGYTMPPYDSNVSGDDAESYEVTEYSASIESNDKAHACATVAGLKSRDYVIFENSNESSTGCNYTFKVKKQEANGVLDIIKGLNPKDVSDNTYTIKNQVEDITDELAVLERQRTVIEETLTSALTAYDELTRLATETREPSTLARVIESKIEMIERLTNQRMQVNASIDRLAESKADQIDRLEYTRFNVSIYENKFVDGRNLKDSWKRSIQQFVRETNMALQNATLGLTTMIVTFAPFILYFFILLLVAKYGWRATKKIWNS